LGGLERRQAGALADHARYWQLLAAKGNKTEAINRKEYDKAREVSQHTDVKCLFPGQAKWLAEARQELAASPTAR